MHKRYLICFWGSNILLQSGYLVPKIILQYAFTLTKQQLNMVHSTKNGKNLSTVYYLYTTNSLLIVCCRESVIAA